MADGDRKSTATAVFVVSMALLVTGLGIGGPLGILLNVAAIAGCVTSLVMQLGGKDPGSDAGGGAAAADGNERPGEPGAGSRI